MNTPDLDNLFSAEEIHSDKGYTVSTLEKQQEFANKRNYQYVEVDLQRIVIQALQELNLKVEALSARVRAMEQQKEQ